MAVTITSGTTTANTVSTVTFATYYPRVEVVNRGSVDLWVKADNTSPTVAGDECEVVPALSWKDNIVNQNPANTVVKLISTTGVDFTVKGIS